MNLSRLAARNIAGSAFRSGAVFLCAALVASVTLAATMVVGGAQSSLRHSLTRMGADIIVVPWGTWRADEMQGARLMNMTDDEWMPRAYAERVAAVRGVAAVSTQRHLFTVSSPSSCSSPEVFVVAFDPATDFAVQPWRQQRPGGSLAADEALVGACMADLPIGAALDLRGYAMRVADILQPTGSDLDQAIFVSTEAGQAIAEWSRANGVALGIVPDSVSAALIQVTMGSDPHDVAVRILEQVPSVLPIESTNLFQTERAQMVGLLRSVLALLAVIWVLSTVFVGLVFAIAANERRQEIGVLRALGCPRHLVMRLLLTEGAMPGPGGWSARGHPRHCWRRIAPGFDHSLPGRALSLPITAGVGRPEPGRAAPGSDQCHIGGPCPGVQDLSGRGSHHHARVTMNLLRLTVRNIAGSSFRSWTVFACAALMAGFAVSATLVIGGAKSSLDLALQRMGADIIVVPSGAETRVQDALLMGVPVHCWMPASNVAEIAAIPGVTTVSPQLYLATLVGATCCAVPEMFLIAYDPVTDFTLHPWLQQNLEGGLLLGQAVGGGFVYLAGRAGQDPGLRL